MPLPLCIWMSNMTKYLNFIFNIFWFLLVNLTQVNSELLSAPIHCWWGSLRKNDVQKYADWPATAMNPQVRSHHPQYGCLEEPVHKLWEREMVHISMSTLLFDLMLMSLEEELLPFSWESEPARAEIKCTLEQFHLHFSLNNDPVQHYCTNNQ